MYSSGPTVGDSHTDLSDRRERTNNDESHFQYNLQFISIFVKDFRNFGSFSGDENLSLDFGKNLPESPVH